MCMSPSSFTLQALRLAQRLFSFGLGYGMERGQDDVNGLGMMLKVEKFWVVDDCVTLQDELLRKRSTS